MTDCDVEDHVGGFDFALEEPHLGDGADAGVVDGEDGRVGRGRAGDATLEAIGVDLGDAEADAVAAVRGLNRLPEDLDALDSARQAEVGDLDFVGHRDRAADNRAGQDRAVAFDAEAVIDHHEELRRI